MLEKVIRVSVERRGIVIALWALVAALGAAAFAELPFDAFPDVTPVQVQVNVAAQALSPLEIEALVTAPVEAALSGIPGLVQLRSLSRPGLSQTTLVFEDGTDVFRARAAAAERVARIELPSGIERPAIGPMATGLGEIFHYLLVSETRSLSELRTLHERVVKPRLASVAGIAEINTWGGDERRLDVVIDPERLLRYGLSFGDVLDAVRSSVGLVGGGSAVASGEASLVRGLGAVRGAADARAIVVAARDGVPVRVQDVADVREGREIRTGAVTESGKGEAVLGLAFMLPGGNGRTIAEDLRERVVALRASLPADVEIRPVYDRADLVSHVLETVRTNLLEGALLVIAVLFAFLGHLRAGLIVALAIPLSLLVAANGMLRFGIAGSLMSLGAIDFGLLVDSSVILVENAVRKLSAPDDPRTAREIVVEAALEVRRPTMFGELIILAVFLPVLTLEGIEGRLFRPMALTMALALLGSIVLSLTLTPALASLLLKKRPHAREPLAARAALALYRPFLRLALAARGAVIGAAVVAVAAGAVLASRLGSEFVPRLSEMAIAVNTVRLSGVSLEESVRYGMRIETILLEAFPDEIEHVWTRTGSAEIATDPMGVELSDMFVTLTHREEWTKAATQGELVAKMAEALRDLPGMRLVFSQPIEMRVNEMTAGVRGDVGVRVTADEFETLESVAREVEAALRSVPGAADIATESITGLPQLEIEVDRENAARHGVAAARVLEAVEALGGIEAAQVLDGPARYGLALVLPEAYRDDAAALATLPVATLDGGRVPLGAVASIRRSTGPAAIQREWGRRRLAVQCNVRGRDVGSFVAEARQAVAERVALPPGAALEWTGQFEHLERARRRLLVVVPLTLGIVALLLLVTYKRFLDAARVFIGVPFAAVGGVAALALRGLPFSLSAAVGFLALAGISVLGDMVLVSRVRQLEEDEGLPLLDAVREAAETRLRPVLMTALVASLGFLPMALNTGVGAEVQRPLATVVIGGLLSSTALTLLVLPALFVALRTRKALPAA